MNVIPSLQKNQHSILFDALVKLIKIEFDSYVKSPVDLGSHEKFHLTRLENFFCRSVSPCVLTVITIPTNIQGSSTINRYSSSGNPISLMLRWLLGSSTIC